MSFLSQTHSRRSKCSSYREVPLLSIPTYVTSNRLILGSRFRFVWVDKCIMEDTEENYITSSTLPLKYDISIFINDRSVNVFFDRLGTISYFIQSLESLSTGISIDICQCPTPSFSQPLSC